MKIKKLPNPELLEEIKNKIPEAVEVIIPFWGDYSCFDIGEDGGGDIEASDENGDIIDLKKMGAYEGEILWHITDESKEYIYELLDESKFFFQMDLFISGYVSFDLKKGIVTLCLSGDMNDINFFKDELESQDRSDEEIDEILKSFPKDYFVEGGEDMIESFSMTDK
tara:strand:- start:184 stop:684 length:501 start_codon:yes stop_codon:yes gene_type:complete